MGQTQSADRRLVTTEQLSHELANSFAEKCFTPLEITHFKDVFRTLADEQDGIKYWREETLCRFLVLPDALGPGPVIYQMATYLGAFPFPSLAPSILTIEAMIKVVVVMTERYGKILKRGRTDRNKLLFRSLAVFDRRMSTAHAKPIVGISEALDHGKIDADAHQDAHSHTAGFSVDEPGNDENDEDDDELALAALESMDAPELFHHEQRPETHILHSQIPVDNFRRLLMLLLIAAPLGAQDNLSLHAERLTDARIQGLRRVADCILWSFIPEENAGIFWSSFSVIVPASLPFLFDGLNPLFEHFLFSKNIDLARRKRTASTNLIPVLPTSRMPITSLEPLLQAEGEILDLNVLSQLSFFIKGSSIFRRLRLLYTGGDAGFSIGSFEQKVLNWRAPTILLVAGTRLSAIPKSGAERNFAEKLPPKRFPDGAAGNSPEGKVVFGAYINTPWKHTFKEAIGDSGSLLFQLEPIHEVFKASNLNRDYATLTKSGIGYGSPPPRAKPVAGLDPHLVVGAVSLILDESLEFGVFTHDSAGGGSYHTSQSRKYNWQDRFQVESLEVWGCGGEEEAGKQKAAWAFEEREANARKNPRFGRDVEADRAILEMAGLIGDAGHSGGSVG